MNTFHIFKDRIWSVLTLDIVLDEDASYINTTRFKIYDGMTETFHGWIERTDNHVSHQVHDRIRYDNKPVTVWRAMPTTPGLYDDTRSEAISKLLKLNSRFDLHLAHRPRRWAGCTLHGET